jgi:hypothetical protein
VVVGLLEVGEAWGGIGGDEVGEVSLLGCACGVCVVGGGGIVVLFGV